MQLLKNKLRDIEWVSSPDEKSLSLVIERIRNDEKILPDRIETITYGYYDVNAFNALLLMPKNASYLYEIAKSGAEIEYGYGVTVSKNGKQIFDELARGKVVGDATRCQNQRIQNVFGGVSSANFMANDDMQRRCAYSSPITLESLRSNVLEKVIEVVSSVPEIKQFQELVK